MIVTIHQPEFLPWLGFFNRLIKADVFVILDHVQYQKNGYINRNKIKGSQGSVWLTVPINKKMTHFKINQVKISGNDWQNKQLKTLAINYAKAPFFEKYYSCLKRIYEHNWSLINELDLQLIQFVLSELEIKTKLVMSSDLRITGKATDLLINICQALKADQYLSGIGGKNYLQEAQFTKNKIKLIYQDFQPQKYQQLFRENGFISDLSVIDLLFNHGPKGKKYLK